MRACNLAFCDRDLAKRYGVDPEAVRQGRADGSAGSKEEDGTSGSYRFTCPCCADDCQASSCKLPVLTAELSLTTFRPKEERSRTYRARRMLGFQSLQD
jgi:hypothetical protein